MTASQIDQATDLLLDFIAGLESAGNYNAVIGDAQASDDLSAFTLTEIIALQGRLVADGQPSSAVGRYQILKTTLLAMQVQLQIPGTERFTPDLQDRLAVALLVRRGYSDWWTGKINDREFAHRLSLEWASLPDPNNGGKSHYDGIGPNHAGTTLAVVYATLQQVRSLIPKAPPDRPSLDPALVAEAKDAAERLGDVLGRLQAALAAL